MINTLKDVYFYGHQHIIGSRMCLYHSGKVIFKHDVYKQFHASLC